MEDNNKIKVTEVSIYRKQTPYKVMGYASIILNNMLCIKNIAIIQKSNGELAISMPSIRTARGEFKNIVFPINSTARALIENAVLDAYNSGKDNYRI